MRREERERVAQHPFLFTHPSSLVSHPGFERQRDRKARATVEFAFRLYGSSVGFHDVLYDGKAQAGSPGAARALAGAEAARPVGAPEPLEDTRQVLGQDADARVG